MFLLSKNRIRIFQLIAAILFSFFFLSAIRKEVFAQTGSLTFSPSTTSAGIGQNITVKIMMNTGEDEVNSAVANFTYPQNLLQFVSVSGAESVFENEQQQEGGSGTVIINRYTESYYIGLGEVARVTFKTLASGTATLQFTSDASLITGYDDPSDALKTKGTATYLIGSLPASGIESDLVLKTFLIIIGLMLINIGFVLFLERRNKLFKSVVRKF